MADWKEKLETFPEFGRYKMAPPDVSSIQNIKDKLKCRDFSYFIDKFYKVYHWAGFLPQKVFHLRDSNSGLCLQRSHGNAVILAQCSDSDSGQLWHKSNRNRDACCSGYRNWNTDQCISSGFIGAKATTHVCNIGGLSSDQFIQLNPETHQLELTKRSGACLGGELVPRPKAQLEECRTAFTSGMNHQEFQVNRISGEDVVQFEDVMKPGVCLAAMGGGESSIGRIEIHTCDKNSVLQHFLIQRAGEGDRRVEALGLTAGSLNRLCLDAGASSGIVGLYPCYANNNLNQDVVLTPVSETMTDVVRIEFRDSHCVAIPDEKIDDSSLNKPLELHGCVSDNKVVKRGQAFEKVFADQKDLTVFALKNRDGNCITSNSENHFVLSKDACATSHFKQEPSDIHKRLKHLPSGLCFDGNNGVTPVLYTCYEGENTNQQIDLTDGMLKLERTETCIDSEPVKPSPVTAIPCSVAESAFKWEEYKPFVPIETEIYNRKKGDSNPGAPQVPPPDEA